MRWFHSSITVSVAFMWTAVLQHPCTVLLQLETFEAAGSALMVLLKCKDSAAAGNAKLAICNTADHPKARIELQKVLKEEAAEYLKGLPDLPPEYRYHVPKSAMMYTSPKTV